MQKGLFKYTVKSKSQYSLTLAGEWQIKAVIITVRGMEKKKSGLSCIDPCLDPGVLSDFISETRGFFMASEAFK